MTPEERKNKVAELKKEHKDIPDDAQYIPKMAYRPSGKDELHVSFFPSELDKGKDVYTEFVSIEYDSEDPKRTLYLWSYNEHWKEEYELITSSNGFERHIIPVAELKVINDVNSRNAHKEEVKDILDFDELSDPDEGAMIGSCEFQLKRIADQLEILTYYIKKIGT